jgi:hypothetical protein
LDIMRKLSFIFGAAAIVAGIGLGCLAADPQTGRDVPVKGHSDAKPQRTPAVKVMPLDRYVFLLQPGKGMPPMLAPTIDKLKSQDIVATPVTVAADRNATAKALQVEIARLLAAGTPGNHITVVGWGASGDDLVAAAEHIGNGDIGYVLIDGCAHKPIAFRQPLKGRFLSLAVPKPQGSGASCSDSFAGHGAADGFSFDEVWVRPSPDGNRTIPQLMIAEAINAWVHETGDDSDYDPR